MSINKNFIGIIEELKKIKLQDTSNNVIIKELSDNIHQLYQSINNNIIIEKLHQESLANTFTIETIKKILKRLNYSKIRNKDIKKFLYQLNHYQLSNKEFTQNLDLHYLKILDLIKHIEINNLSDELNSLISYYRGNIFSRFISINILIEIVTKLKNKSTYQVKFNNNTLKFTIFNDNKIDNKLLNILCIKSFIILELFKIKNFDLDITLYLTNKKKILPKKSNILTPDSINSGMTTRYFSGKCEIAIFRKEEIEKVLIHELLHAIQIETHIWNNNSIEEKIKCHFNIPSDMKINFAEAYIECSAVIFNSYINSCLLNYNLQDMLNNEYKFSIFQCHKILHFFGFKDDKTFFMNDKCYDNKKKYLEMWREKTSVFSYFILKTSLLLNHQLFLQEFVNVNSVTKSSSDYFNKLFNYMIQGTTKLFENMRNVENQVMKSSLRMTLYEIKW